MEGESRVVKEFQNIFACETEGEIIPRATSFERSAATFRVRFRVLVVAMAVKEGVEEEEGFGFDGGVS